MGQPSIEENKKLKKPIDVEVKEVAETLAPTPPKIFQRDYLTSRKDDKCSITIPVNSKFPLPIAPVPKGVN